MKKEVTHLTLWSLTDYVTAHPQAGNIGGGGFMVLQKKLTKLALDYREKPIDSQNDVFWTKMEMS
jgi:gamma-glutamyltranspeptidase